MSVQLGVDDEMNLITCSMAELEEDLYEAFFECDQLEDPFMLIHQPLIMLGPIGCGKTTLIHQFTKKHGLGFKEIRLANHDVTDLVGLPKVDETTTASGQRKLITKWIQCGLLPDKDDPDFKPRGILFLDEITNAPPLVQAAAWQLTDTSRSVGEYHLPDGWKVVCAGNGPADGGNADVAITSALLTRGEACRVEVETESWLNWAKDNDIDPTIIAYIKLYGRDKLWGGNLDIETISNGVGMPTPRSWEFLSKRLSIMKNTPGTKTAPLSKVLRAAGKNIGKNEAGAFAAFYQNKEKMIDVDGVFDGSVNIDKTLFQDKSREVMYIESAAICKRIYDAITQDKKSAYKDANAFKTACRGFELIVCMGEVAIDAATAITQDLSDMFMSTKGHGSENSTYIDWNIHRMTDIARECPKWDRFYSDHQIMFG